MADMEVEEGLDQAEGYEEPIVETIQRLADLPVVEYEQARKAEAKRLNMRASALDREVNAARKNGHDENDLGLFEPELWPEEVDGDDLLDRIVGAICRRVVMPPHAAEATALWVVHCHAFECWRHTPRLAILAPEKECGKSTLLDVLLPLVPRAVKTENLSTAVMFRLVDKCRPVLLVDEVDTFLRDNEELRGALNAGHAKGGSHLRCEGDDNQIKAFKTFAPAALAGIGRLPETLADRSVMITLQKRKPGEYVEDFRDDRADDLRELASQAARWVRDHETELRQLEPAMPEGIHNRRADNWRPLLGIADLAGGEWPGRGRAAAVALTRGATDDVASIRVMLLEDIRDVFNETGHDHLFSEEIVDHLLLKEDRPWSEFGRQNKPITKVKVARLLKPFGIVPSTVRRDLKTGKGYKLSALMELFERYLTRENSVIAPTPPNRNVTTSQVKATAGLRRNQNVTTDTDVTFRKSLKAKATAGCDVVTDRNGGGPKTLFQADSEGDLEEREAIQAIDGEAALCIHCNEFVALDEPSIPCNGRVLHEHCHDAFFGFEGQYQPSN